MQEATTFNIFYDGISFQHLATLLISVFMLCYGPGLLFHGPPCTLMELKRHRNFWTQVLKGTDFLWDISVGKRIILKRVLEIDCDSTYLEQDPVLG
jgi:hypothetical protein